MTRRKEPERDGGCGVLADYWECCGGALSLLLHRWVMEFGCHAADPVYCRFQMVTVSWG
jgi:hypothetical protein